MIDTFCTFLGEAHWERNEPYVINSIPIFNFHSSHLLPVTHCDLTISMRARNLCFIFGGVPGEMVSAPPGFRNLDTSTVLAVLLHPLELLKVGTAPVTSP